MIRNLHIVNKEPLTYEQYIQIMCICEDVGVNSNDEYYDSDAKAYYNLVDSGFYDIFDDLCEYNFMYNWDSEEPSPTLTKLTYNQFLAKYVNQKPAIRRECK